MIFDLIDGQFIKHGDKIFGTDFPDQLLFIESIRAIRNRLMFWDEHLVLINLQLQLLNQKMPAFMKNDARELKRQIERTLVKNKFFKSAKIDLFLLANDKSISYLVRTGAIDSTSYEFNNEGIVIEPFKRTFKSDSPLSSLRTGSDPYWKIGRAFQSSSLTEPVLLNEKGCLLEAPERNLYLIQGTEIHTAAPGSGIYIDPSREMIRKICEKTGLSFHEDEFLSEGHLLQADEVFLAGDLHGIQWVKGFGMKRYLNKTVRRINDLLNHELLVEE
jgi:branched-chain amino acid aminotransferase